MDADGESEATELKDHIPVDAVTSAVVSPSAPKVISGRGEVRVNAEAERCCIRAVPSVCKQS